MPSPFDEFDAAMQADVDALFGEGIKIIPRAGDEYTSAPDPERPSQEGIRATVARAPGSKPATYRGSQRTSADIHSSPAEIWIDRAAYAALGYELRRGDIIELTDDDPATRYTVGSVGRGDGGDVRIILG
ncbi:hypothetical protein CFBP5507_06040 [Agrobacterium salinitolerans]|uniref:Uncharacterized protein n=1 Tax=Agrobacterium salinitolerans TaxID=1183413 RepID=A0A4Z1QWF6_9HYPH|nr:hypothetical protein [Agrobacterium salinitolerans]UYZ08560.1 hypothetical protein CFBP5507_06040 [Agrobacterium salinitolerans]